MKNDASRNTFDARKHFSSVRMQQGRVQIDADGNEQSDIVNYRVETEARDVIGLCGAPMHYPAFHIVGALNQLSTEEQVLPGNKTLPDSFKLPDFLISAGRYYVDGILCENEQLTSYLKQADLPNATLITETGLHLVYVDVWQRHMTALDDPSIREIALGGPDTATRTKTVWQVKHWFTRANTGNCRTPFTDFEEKIAAGDGRLSARTRREEASTNPCIVPPGAGYNGLENQLYRVEVHGAGDAFDVTTGGAGTLVTRVPNTNNQVKFPSGTWQVDDAVEIFSSKVGSDPMNGTLAFITDVNAGAKTLTLDINVSDIALDELRLRLVKATYKWSRNNAFVATSIESINVIDQELTVHDLGPDAVLGFREGQWVEISDDRLELNGLPGQLVQIAKIDPAINLITLSSKPTALSAKAGGVDKSLHPKLRQWDGIGAIKFHPKVTEDHFLDLENGVQVRFFAGTFKTGDSFKTGDYWTIPARTATADVRSGNIEWPTDVANKPLAQLPFGIKHHYCRLAMLHWDGTTFDVIQDCRSLFPPITELTSLFYVSGDGQEAMPDLTEPAAFLPLPQQLIVGVANGELPVPNAEVRFQVDATKGNGRVLPNGAPGSFHQVDSKTLDVLTDQDGLARCLWQLDSVTQSQQLKANLQAVTDLNDLTDHPVHLPVIFTANLSVASQVAYNPGDCQPLHDDKTVQKALDRLSHLISLYEVSGNNQEILPGETLQPLVVLAANRCGAITDQMLKVHFKIVSGGGKVNDQDEIDVGILNGLATCDWTPGPTAPNQEVEASLVGDSSHAVAEPTKVRFTSTLSLASHVYYDPSKCPALSADNVTNVQEAIDHLCAVGGCSVTVGKGGQFERLDQAIVTLLKEKRVSLCICLLPGEHELPEGLQLSDEEVGVEIKIEGCGATSIILPRKPIVFKDRLSVILRDLVIYAKPVSPGSPLSDPIQIIGCDHVTLEGCFIGAEGGITGDLLTLTAVKIRWRIERLFLVSITQAWQVFMKFAHIKDPSPFTLWHRGGLEVVLEKVVERLITLKTDSWEKLLGSLREFISENALATLAKLPADSAGRAKNRAMLLGAVHELAFAPALALLVGGVSIADVSISDSTIYGDIRLYGKTEPLSDDDWKTLSKGIRQNDPTLVSTGSLEISGSRLLGRCSVDQGIKDGRYILTFRRLTFTNNILHGVQHQFLASHIGVTSNYFDLDKPDELELGVVTGHSAVVVGNSSALQDQVDPGHILFYAVPTFKEAANIFQVKAL
jgi:hypothetical protein